MKKPLLTLFTVAALSLSLSAQAKPTGALPWVKAKVEEGKALINKPVKAGSKEEAALREDVKSRLEALLDWDLLTERSLGRRWKKLSEKEQAEFSKLLREMIEASYADKLKSLKPGEVKKAKKKPVKITWGEEREKKGGVEVNASVRRGKTEAELRFSLVRAGKAWKVWDVAIDDVSTVRTYRSQFRRIIQKEGVDGLLKRMRAKIEDIKAGRAGVPS